ncbi:MAG TPA: ABC transporter permease, partial [Chloroflexota bacterium]|nr:ABC transporter permease [Chloroflexota bacterium]
GTLVAAELTGTTTGLGATIFAASKFFRMDIVVVAIIIIGVIGVAMDLVMRFLEARLIPWRGKG